MSTLARTLISVSGLLACYAATASECRFRAERTDSVELGDADKVVVNAGAGELNIAGNPTAKGVEGRGVACASSQAALDSILLKVRRQGRTILVETYLPEIEVPGEVFAGSYARLDLNVSLPSTLAVEARDTSGDAVVSGVKSLAMHDTSGDLTVRNIAGLADVHDSSGDLVLEHVGSARLEDSSGDIRVLHAASDVTVDVDSSGGIEIDDVGGPVNIRQDSSGDIRVTNVRGSVDIGDDSSGAIVARDVGGDFTVHNDSSGGIKYQNVKGTVRVP